jgi:hypothetical protein
MIQNSIYPNDELETKDTSVHLCSYLDIWLKLDANSKLTTELHDTMNFLNCSIVNNQFHLYVDLVYPNDELEIKDNTECSIFPLYVDML